MIGQSLVTYNDWEDSWHVYPLKDDVLVMPEAMYQVSETPVPKVGIAFGVVVNEGSPDTALSVGMGYIKTHKWRRNQ